MRRDTSSTCSPTAHSRRRRSTRSGGGSPAPLSASALAVAQLAVAPNGTIAYIVEEPPSLTFMDRAGTARAVLDARHNYHGPRFSPDGRRVALDFNSGDGRDVWIV